MKIEKVNDYQIRCTLTSDDLADRQIKISELVYGSDKTKKLFRDMMQQASVQFGFEAEDIPLMIEAIPLNSGCLVLVITKVEDPEELDTRFSNFAPSIHDDDDDYEEENMDVINSTGSFLSETALDVLDLFRRMQSAATALPDKGKDNAPAAAAEEADTDISILYSFTSLDHLIRVARMLAGGISTDTALYKNTITGQYSLVVSKGKTSPAEFNRLCNTLSEYGKGERLTHSASAFLEEHFDAIIPSHAVEAVAQSF
ncbi:MAG: adaptor protein MecA [Lachnospiraceae bacterium]|nr:adaptor protein MecA [Lachnospiraceae bacterium]MDE7239978.1 adaptor protein MecA [Lachnospiraceae bacterium]